MKTNYLLIMLGASLALAAQQISAFAPSTALKPHDQVMRLSTIKNKKYRIKVAMESTLADRPYDLDQRRTNALTMYDKDQATITMLRNPVSPNNGATPAAAAQADSRKAAIDTLLRAMGNPADNGIRGHIKPTGSYSEISIMPTVGASVELPGLPGHFGVDLHIPVVRKQITALAFQDQTQTTGMLLPVDYLVEAKMPNMLQTIATFGNLSTSKWVTAGLGDTAMMLSWRNWFRQEKELVKGVELYAQLGVTLPTGKERDEDQAFSMPLGSDGAFGIPVGFGLNVQFINTIRAGLNVDFLAYLDKTKDRRLKTQAAQTELFLLNKGRASRDSGLNWQFYLYLQSRHFIGGLSAKAAYQYLRHDSDKLTPRDNGFAYDVINSAKSLQDWNAHNAIFSIDYDHIDSSDSLVTPQISMFYKMPIAGKAVIAAQTVGVQMGVAF